MPQKCHGLRKYGHDRADEDPHFTGGFADYCYILPGTGILKLPDGPERRGGDAAQLRGGHDGPVTEAAALVHGRCGRHPGARAAGPLRRGLGPRARRAPGDRARRGAGAAGSGQALRRRSHHRRRPAMRKSRHGGARRLQARWRRRGDRGVRGARRHPGRVAHAAHGRALRAGRSGQPRRQRDDRCQRAGSPVGHAARDPQLPPAAPGAGARLRDGQPRPLSVPGHRRLAVRADTTSASAFRKAAERSVLRAAIVP